MYVATTITVPNSRIYKTTLLRYIFITIPDRYRIRMRKKLLQYLELILHIGFIPATTYKLYNQLSIKKPLKVHLLGNDITIRTMTHDLGVARSSLGDEFAALGGLLDKDFDGLIIDAGGYIGTAALKLAALYPNAQVVSIEPATENYDILTQNIKNTKNITAIKAALVPVSGEDIVLSNRSTGEWGYTIVDTPSDNPDATEIEKIKTITLSEIRAMHGQKEIGIMKLDIEGGEKELMQRDAASLNEIYAIFVELHDRIVDGCSDTFKNFSSERLILNFGGEKFLSIKK